jgi:hypothetical protein
MKNCILFYIMITLFLLPTLTFAKENNKINVAVFKIQAYNCSQEFGGSIGEIVMTRVFSTSLFILKEDGNSWTY